MLGEALKWDGRFAEAGDHLLRAFRLDSSAMLGRAPHCTGCDALQELASTYVMTDSMAAAERIARRFVAMVPGSATPWRLLEDVLEAQGRYGEADAAARRANGVSPLTPVDAALSDVRRALRRGAFAVVAERLAFLDASGSPASRCEADWWRTISERNQGRRSRACARGRAGAHALLARVGSGQPVGAAAGGDRAR